MSLITPITKIAPATRVALLICLLALGGAAQLGVAAQLKWSLWLCYGILSLSLLFIWGKVGIFNFGHTAFFGLGAYTYAVLSLNLQDITGETVSALAGAGIVAAALALVMGVLLFYGKVSDVYFAIVSLAITLILYTLFSSMSGPQYRIGAAFLGGFNGIPSLPPLVIGIPGFSTKFALTGRPFLYFLILLITAIYIFLKRMTGKRSGLVIDGVRLNPVRMELLGYDIRKLQLLYFMLSGSIAGIAGGLFAAWGAFVDPSVFSLSQAALLVIWVMVGGKEALSGALLGVFCVQWISDNADRLLAGQTPLVLGLVLILVVLMFPRGLAGLLSLAGSRWRLIFEGDGSRQAGSWQTVLNSWVGGSGSSSSSSNPSNQALTVSSVAKSFGGSVVLRDVSFSCGPRELISIIGANGAGKSTLFNVLVGRIEPTGGAIVLNGRPIESLLTHQRIRNGLGIKTQVPSVFLDLTVENNLELAMTAPTRGVRERGANTREEVAELLLRSSMDKQLAVKAGSLSHGARQWLEIAMVLAHGPELILLDEPCAGMTQPEKALMVELIHKINERHAIIVVEHDMRFIRDLQARVLVIHNGTVYRDGGFEEITNDQEVIDAYLGRR